MKEDELVKRKCKVIVRSGERERERRGEREIVGKRETET